MLDRGSFICLFLVITLVSKTKKDSQLSSIRQLDVDCIKGHYIIIGQAGSVLRDILKIFSLATVSGSQFNASSVLVN